MKNQEILNNNVLLHSSNQVIIEDLGNANCSAASRTSSVTPYSSLWTSLSGVIFSLGMGVGVGLYNETKTLKQKLNFITPQLYNSKTTTQDIIALDLSSIIENENIDAVHEVDFYMPPVESYMLKVNIVSISEGQPRFFPDDIA